MTPTDWSCGVDSDFANTSAARRIDRNEIGEGAADINSDGQHRLLDLVRDEALQPVMLARGLRAFAGGPHPPPPPSAPQGNRPA